jgi:The GLUG motif.
MKIITVFFCLLILISSVNVAVSLSLPAPFFEVYTVEDLKSVEYHQHYVSYVVLMNDLEITDEVWKPIGQANRPFNLTFYGNNHTITFTKDTEFMPSVGSENSGCGLFGYIYDGQIRDLNVVLQGNLTSLENNTGALVGIINLNYSAVLVSSSPPSATILNCSVSSNGYSVSGENNVGGMVGNIIRGSIKKSSSDCSVTASGNNAGGLVGFTSHGTILDSSASGSVKAAENAGGLIGYISNQTTVSNSSVEGSVEPVGFFGNFIGNWDENYKPTVVNCKYQEAEVDLESVPIPLDPILCYSGNSLLFYLAAGIGIILLIVIAATFYFKKRSN